MRIDEENDRKIGREKRIDLIRRYQEQQSKLDAGGGKEAEKLDLKKLEKMSSGDLLKELQKLTDRTTEGNKVDDVKNVDKKTQIQAMDVQRDLQRTEIQRQVVDGATKSAEAVSSAQKQQTRGENWQKFQAQEHGAVPQSVEEKAKTEKSQQDRDDVERQEKERMSVRELQNDMAVKSRMIKS